MVAYLMAASAKYPADPSTPRVKVNSHSASFNGFFAMSSIY